jgi:tRNA(fMet)-specific endonuclease VapC
MSFLLDSDICSAYLRRPGSLFARFMQYSGQLWISTITLSESPCGQA